MIEGGENSLRLSFAPVPAEQMPPRASPASPRALERLRAGSPA